MLIELYPRVCAVIRHRIIVFYPSECGSIATFLWCSSPGARNQVSKEGSEKRLNCGFVTLSRSFVCFVSLEMIL